MSKRTNEPSPVNSEPRVSLLSAEGDLLRAVSYAEAVRLLRARQAEVVLDGRAAVRLLAPPEGEGQGEGRFLHARRSALYGNFTVEAPTGAPLFRCDGRRALWYLIRGLAEVVCREPPTLRLKFEPGGPGHAGDPYYLGEKHNRCVACGSEEGLSRHHVVPRCYRRHLPRQVKSRSHHDVLLLCLACHERYEAAALSLRLDLARESGCPLHGLYRASDGAPYEADKARSAAIRAATALVRFGDRIPAERRAALLRTVEDWAGGHVDEPELERVAHLDARPRGEEGLVDHGAAVVGKLRSLDEVQAFVHRWRQHFLDSLRPRFLPESWAADRPVVRVERPAP
jgi:hypothetical protein